MLTKKVDLSGRKLTLKCSAMTPRMYRSEFNRDMLRDFQTLTESITSGSADVEILENLLYMMAKHGGSSKTENIEMFLESFSNPAVTYQAVGPLFELWNEGLAMTSGNAKKKEAP